MKKTVLSSVCILLLVATAVPSTVAAANNTTSQDTPVQETPEQEEGGGFLDIGGQIQKAISSVLMDLVKGLATKLNGVLVRIFVSYPDVTQSRVLEIHQKVFRVSLALASAAAVWIGLMHMFDRIDGVRPLISLLVAVAFGAVAPDLLYYPVEISRLTTDALAPTDPNLLEVTRFTLEYFLVLLVDVFLLLGTVMIFVARDVYLMIGVSLSPLIALMAATPKLRGYADTLISIWIGCLLIGPLDAVVLDLTLSFMGTDALVPGNYFWGLGGIALLFGLPLILLGSGVVVFAPLTRIAGRSSGAVQPKIREKTKNFVIDKEEQRSGSEEQESRRDRGNRFRRRRGGDD